jgi:hypothetical protein
MRRSSFPLSQGEVARLRAAAIHAEEVRQRRNRLVAVALDQGANHYDLAPILGLSVLEARQLVRSLQDARRELDLRDLVPTHR